MENKRSCEHIDQLNQFIRPKDHICEECIKTGDRWVHLRTCQTCGATLCCDSSPNKHMTNHYHQTSHPVVISAEPGKKWIWCYKDEVLLNINYARMAFL